ncbi:MAG: Ser-Thr-rich GPI-anchored membrane family protein [bacterium]
MKNTQRGFIVPLMMMVVVLLGVGVATYFYMQNTSNNKIKQESTPENPSPVKELTNNSSSTTSSIIKNSDNINKKTLKTTVDVFPVVPTLGNDVNENWSTYTNDKIDFTFKYPPTMGQPTVSEQSTGIEISFANSLDFREGIRYNQVLGRNFTYEETVDNEVKNPEYSNVIKRNITVGGKKAIEVIYHNEISGGGGEMVFIPVDSKGNILEISSYSRAVNNVGGVGIDEIIPTIIFTNKTNSVLDDVSTSANTSNTNGGSAVKIISPNKSTVWKAGKSVQINWSGPMRVITISAMLGWGIYDSSRHDYTYFNPNPGVSIGTYTWNIPSDILPGLYQVQIENSGLGMNAASDIFTIENPLIQNLQQ